MPPFTDQNKLQVENVTDGETIYQRSLLLKGRCSHAERASYISVKLSNGNGQELFPVQTWPVSQGYFKALVLLSPGHNRINLESHSSSAILESFDLNVVYTPLPNVPKLHLAIMIARDSPQRVDCPVQKGYGVNTEHSDLTAVVAKFRMTAYMWQALTAEDMRLKGLGRRSFQLEEELTSDTLSRAFVPVSRESQGRASRPTAKVHLVRTNKTVTELRHEDVAQQKQGARDAQGLFRFFHEALNAYGAPLHELSRPTVAGLILDAHYSMEKKLIVGHAALGAQNRGGTSLGIFGSHLVYSWPRYLEEVSQCLLDTTVPGDNVGNDCNECGTIWEACSIGQGAFLHEVGHAFGAPHTYGIMARGYAQHWPRNFVSQTAYCSHTREKSILLTGQEQNNARWALQDALTFKALPNFALPTDVPLDPSVLNSRPTATVGVIDGNNQGIVFQCNAGIALVILNDVEDRVTYHSPPHEIRYALDELKRRFNSQSLKATIVGMNGRILDVNDLWKHVSESSGISIPGASWVVSKRAVATGRLERGEISDDKLWNWAILLKKFNGQTLIPASAIDTRIGCFIDGLEIYYADGERVPGGPRWDPDGNPHKFGGHLSQKVYLPANAEIVRIQLTRNNDTLFGMRIYFSDGKGVGELNFHDGAEMLTLEAEPNEKIIGLFGRAQWQAGFAQPHQLGILTIPKQAELPASAYGMPELQNTNGGGQRQWPAGLSQNGIPPRPYHASHQQHFGGTQQLHLARETGKKVSEKLKKFLHR